MNRRDFLKAGPALAAGGAALSFFAPAAAAQGLSQVAAAQRFKLGDLLITAISDGYFDIDASLLTGASQDDLDRALNTAHLDPGRYRAAVNAYIVDDGDRVYLIDAGSGAALGPTVGRLESNLRAAGYAPSDITALLITHLHPDHVGGAVGPDGALFGKAELFTTEADHAFWTSAEMRAQAPETSHPFFDLAQAAVAAYGERVAPFNGTGSVVPGITPVPLAGHTPGHSGYRIDSGNDSLLLWGDIVHVGPLQLAQPGVTIAFDVDSAAAAQTRSAILDQVAADRQMVAGMHLPFPGIGYIERHQNGYAFEPAPWQYF